MDFTVTSNYRVKLKLIECEKLKNYIDFKTELTEIVENKDDSCAHRCVFTWNSL